MILVITPSARGQECAESLNLATGRQTHWAPNLQDAVARLREQTYSAAIIDQFLLETEPQESDQMIEHLGTAFPVYINFASPEWTVSSARCVPHCIAVNAKK